MSKQYTDKEILEKLKSGQKAEVNVALRFLYKQYYGMIESVVVKNNGSKVEAMDVFQDGLISFYNQLLHKDLQLNCAIKTYLYSVCRNLWLNQLRKTKRIEGLNETEEYVDVEDNKLQILINSERSQTISNLLEKLGTECRKLLILFYYEKMSIRKITETMQLSSEQNTKTKKSRCLQKLRSIIQSQSGYKTILRP